MVIQVVDQLDIRADKSKNDTPVLELGIFKALPRYFAPNQTNSGLFASSHRFTCTNNASADSMHSRTADSGTRSPE